MKDHQECSTEQGEALMYRDARSDDEVIGEISHQPGDPAGIWLRPAVLGWFGVNGNDPEYWLNHRLDRDLDDALLTEPPSIRVLRSADRGSMANRKPTITWRDVDECSKPVVR
jgi:hypothetical protein